MKPLHICSQAKRYFEGRHTSYTDSTFQKILVRGKKAWGGYP